MTTTSTTPHIYRSKDPAPVIPTEKSVWQVFLEYNPDLVPDDKVVLQEHENRNASLTYGGARKLAAQGAAGLQKVLGLKAGDTVAVVGLNSINWATFAHASIWAGIVIAGINPAATSNELVHYLGVAEPSAIFFDEPFLSKIQEAQKLDSDHRLEKAKLVSLDSNGSQQPGILNWTRDFFSSGTAPVYDLTGVDSSKVPAVICFSSGTSGKPKATQLTHYGLIAHILVIRASEHAMFNADQREVFYAPFCHIYGLNCAVLPPVFIGYYVLTIRAFNFPEYLKACAETRATVLRVVPPTAIAMANDPAMEKIDLTSVQILVCAGAALGTETQERLQRLLGGVHVTQGYGMTEGGITSLKTSFSLTKAGSVGTPMAAVQIRLVDDDLKDVSPGQIGEIITLTPTVFLSYKNNPEATAKAFPFGNNWLRTGDVGYFDKDGFLWLTDRKKELIKYKGNQVPPAELEDIIRQHPAVLESAVCAKWDDSQETEVPLAYVNLKPHIARHEIPQTLQHIRAFVDGRVSSYKKLRGGVHHLETIPKNPTGKVLRRFLPARIELEAKYAQLKRRKGKL